MSGYAEVTAALFSQVLKLIKPLSDEEMKRAASGESRLVLLSPAQLLALKALSQLTPDQLQQIEDRCAKLVLLPKGSKVVHPLDLSDVAAQIVKLANEPEIVTFLDADSRLTPPNLKKLAGVLDISVPTSVKTKSDLQLHIAQVVVRDRGRFTWR